MFCASILADAEVVLPSLIGDNMVIQQQSEVRLWGKATPGSRVIVRPSWSSVEKTVLADKNGDWSLKVKTPSASCKPQWISFTDDDGEVVVGNLLVGEVWYCSGQSNMEMPMRGYKHQPVDGGLDMILNARFSTPIRMFTVGKALSATPLDSCSGHWSYNSPEAVADCSATAYFFADYLSKALEDTPVGIIVSAWGGTAVQPWLSPEVASAAGLDCSALHDGQPEVTTPGALYNAMASPVFPYTVKGMLWYQGESNCADPEEYERLMPLFVDCMRDGFGNKDMPFYYVQIAPHDGYGPLSDNVPLLRLAQSHLMEQSDNCGMVVTLDIGNRYCIHPTDKQTVGKRLAYWALANDYGYNGYACSGPLVERMEWDGKRALIYFSNTGGGVSPLEEPLDGFEAAGADGVYHPARAIVECETGTLSVYCDAVDEIKSVRYAYGACPTATLFDNYQLPAAPFIVTITE